MESISEKHVLNGRNQIFLIVILTICTFALALFSMGLGSSSQLDMFSTMNIIFDKDQFSCLFSFGTLGGSSTFPCNQDLQSQIVWNLRFPRIMMGMITGVALSTAGALMQGCLGNPLVSPLTLGVASGAALGAAFAIVLNLSFIPVPELAIVANAFLFSLIVVAIIIQLGNMRSVSAESYILVGIAITFIAGAIVSTMQYFATDAQLSQLAHWSFGSLSRPDLGNTIWIGLAILWILPRVFKWAWDLNTLSLGGDEFAISTGVEPVSTRRNILIISALMTSIVISFTGLIGFVGLAAPHMSRLLIGNDYRKLIPCSAVFGAFLVVFADTMGRTLFAPIVIPVGIMLSIIGGPFFMYLLLQNRGHAH